MRCSPCPRYICPKSLGCFQMWCLPFRPGQRIRLSSGSAAGTREGFAHRSLGLPAAHTQPEVVPKTPSKCYLTVTPQLLFWVTHPHSCSPWVLWALSLIGSCHSGLNRPMSGTLCPPGFCSNSSVSSNSEVDVCDTKVHPSVDGSRIAGPKNRAWICFK